MTTSDVHELMKNARRQIEERKTQILASQSNEDRISAMNALKARIAATVGNLEQKGVITSAQQAKLQAEAAQAERDKSLNVVIDAEGRTIDRRTGEVIQIQSRMPTLKANIRVAQKKTASVVAAPTATTHDNQVGLNTPFQLQKYSTPEPVQAKDEAQPAFFDSRLRVKQNVQRAKRPMAFLEEGKFVDLANKLRNRAKLECLKQEISKISKKTGISSETKLALIQPKRFTKETSIPDIEWWDYAVLNEANYDSMDMISELELNQKLSLTNLIEHPVQMKPPTAIDKKIIPTVMLTKKERKKMRRQNRSEALKEEQEKIRLGLMAPPEPKVKISNLMRVLGTEAVQDPTKVEEFVRNQMAKRQKKHEEANAARKLTDDQRADKKKRKIIENTAIGVNVCVYRVKDLHDPATKFKIEANCNQLHMTGVVVMCNKSLNVVVVEGGPKQQKKFRRLMLNRIKWSEIVNKKALTMAEDDEEGQRLREKNSCALVWEGMIKQRNFSQIIFKSCPSVTFAREYFKRHNCEHYWDIAQSDAIIELSDL